MTHDEPRKYEKEKLLAFTSIPTCQVQTINIILLFLGIGLHYHESRNTALDRIVHAADRRAIMLTGSIRELQFGGTLIKYQGIGELFLSTSTHMLGMPIYLDIFHANVPALLGLDVFDINSPVLEYVNGYLCNVSSPPRTHGNMKTTGRSN